ncbi:MAG: orotidine 5'-phosphate decarboxylase / HUMPS family protein, partial [Psittacicella sp.]
WLTVCAAAHIATIEAAKKVADKYGKEIQIEIYGSWTLEDAKRWVDLGIKQAIYHRSRDADLAGIGWTDEDINKIKAMSNLGLEVSITGGITPDAIEKFKGIPAKTFIAGRALASSETGVKVAKELATEIDKYW